MRRFTDPGARPVKAVPYAVCLLVSCLVGSTAPAAAAQGLKIQEIGSGASQEVKGEPQGKGASALKGGKPRYWIPESPGQGFVPEVEPNNVSGTATPLGGSNVVVLGNIFPNGDVDFFSFAATAGDRVYAATMTSFSANSSSDSQLDVIDVDGTTSLEFDDDNGVFGGLSSSIAGTVIPADGTYFLRVKHFSATNQLRPYHLHFRLQSGAPTPESEPNDALPGQALPASGWVSGALSSLADLDIYSIALNAGDTVFVSLDLDPERDNVEWNGQLGLGLFNGFFLVANDAGGTGPDSEAFFMTVKDAGTYSVLVNVPSGGATFGTYHLTVSVHPATPASASCTTYTSTNVPQTIPTGPGIVSSTITVPGNPRIADLDVAIQLNHAFMPDLDVHLRSPAGNDNGLFSDIGASSQTPMDLVLDDEAGVPMGLFTVVSGMGYEPELSYRLSWFDGEDAGGTWTLDLRDDATGDGGTLTGWSLTICEPPPPPACAAGSVLETVFTTDFETDDGGFTHSGTADEWERGLPAFAPLTTCNSGTNCWVTDLDNTYNISSNQDLLSPNIDLSNHVAPVTVTWAQRYQMENASFDHFSVDFQEAGGANPRRFFEWLGATMTDAVGSPAVTLQESAGWGVFRRDASAFAGLNSELRFHLDSDTSVNFAGLAIDDVTVTACRLLVADLGITKTDGVANATPGGMVTYTIVASNAGPDVVLGATVADTFPASLTCSWTCVGAGGGSCTAGPVAGNINDSVDLPAGASATYTASCMISAAATGSLVNTATVSSAISDPNGANDSATDTDTLVASADLGITKTDGLTTAAPGQIVTYTIVASNPGPSNAPGSQVVDTFPAALTGVTWTCGGAGGGTCPAAGSGNINASVNLPAGGSVTFSATGTIDAMFLGILSNTATVAPATAVGDPNGANNSATDMTTVVGGASVTGIKSVSGDFTEGGTITYTIQLTNNGIVAQGDNAGDELVDVLPASLTVVSADATSGVAAVAGNTVTWNGTLAANGGTVTITIVATIEAGTVGTTISNQATIHYDSDGNGSNESTAVSDDPVPAGPDDPTDLVVLEGVPPAEIPTLTSLGAGLFALALALLAALALRRRQTLG